MIVSPHRVLNEDPALKVSVDGLPLAILSPDLEVCLQLGPSDRV